MIYHILIRFFLFFFLFAVLSACGNKDDFMTNIEIINVIDSITVNPPSQSDSTNTDPTDTIIVDGDYIITPGAFSSTDSIKTSDKPELEYTKLFKLTCTSRNDPQGIAIYDKYLFHCHHSNDILEIFNLETKKGIATISLDPDNLLHCNNVCFGSEFFSNNDKFPLLYIQYRGAVCKLNAYRIICDGDNIINAEKVQTIHFESCKSCINTIDAKNKLLYAIYNYEGKQLVSSFKMPSVSEGEVSVHPRSALKTYYCPYKKIGQDTAFNGNYFYILCGYNNEGELWRIDMVNKIAKKIDLTKYGIKAEPEGIDLYNGNIILFLPNNPLYKITINDDL